MRGYQLLLITMTMVLVTIALFCCCCCIANENKNDSHKIDGIWRSDNDASEMNETAPHNKRFQPLRSTTHHYHHNNNNNQDGDNDDEEEVHAWVAAMLDEDVASTGYGRDEVPASSSSQSGHTLQSRER